MSFSETFQFIIKYDFTGHTLPDNHDLYKRISQAGLKVIEALDLNKNNGIKLAYYTIMYKSVGKVLPDYKNVYKSITKLGATLLDNKYTSQLLTYNLKGIYSAGQFFQLKLNQGNCLVKIMDNTLGKWKWSIRFDRPHNFVPFPHINLNPKIIGMPDPHTAISSTTLNVAKKTAEVSKEFYKVDMLLPFIFDASFISWNAYKDYQQGTIRNSVTATSSVTGSWIGAFTGAKLGVALGSFICPGFGTVVGAFALGIPGAIYGGFGCQKIADGILDQWNNGIETFNCSSCKNDFQCKKYKGQSREYCIPCDNVEKLNFSYDFKVPVHSSFDKLKPLPILFWFSFETGQSRVKWLGLRNFHDK